MSALRAIPNLKHMTEKEKLGIPAYVIMLKLNEVFRLERNTKILATKEERDAYRKETVRNTFEDLIQTTLGIDITNCPAKNYTSEAIRYMQNQEVYLNQFLEDYNVPKAWFKETELFVDLICSFGFVKTYSQTYKNIDKTRALIVMEAGTPVSYFQNAPVDERFVTEDMIPERE